MYQHADVLLSPCMPGGVKCWEDFLSEVSGTPLQGGSMVVVQTPGRPGHSNPHWPLIATRGGGDTQGEPWVH